MPFYLEFDDYILSRKLRVAWEDDFAGRGQPYLEFWGGSVFMVPLSTSPNWAMSKRHDRLRFILPYEFEGSFRLRRLELLQRD